MNPSRPNTSRRSRSAGIRLLVCSAVCVAITMLAHRFNIRWDLSSQGRHTLSEQSIQFLVQLDQPIVVHGFFVEPSSVKDPFIEQMEGYAQYSDQLQYKTHNATREPWLAQQYDIVPGEDAIVLTAAGQMRHLDVPTNEEILTNAIVQLSSGTTHTICATEGHEEIEPDEDQNPDSYSAALTKLEKRNYTLRRLHLSRQPSVPEECDLVFVADPKTEWTMHEQKHLQDYVLSGGRLLVLLNPTHAPTFADSLQRFGIKVGDNVLLEHSAGGGLMGGDSTYVLAASTQLADHPIFHTINGSLLFRIARTVESTEAQAPGFSVIELIHTSNDAWAETDLDRAHAKPDPGIDPMGSLSLAAVSEHANGGRVLVIGDSDFTSNALLDQVNNFDLLPNAISWLVGEEHLVTLRPQTISSGTFILTKRQGLWMWLMAVLLLPGLLLGAAAATWLHRRER